MGTSFALAILGFHTGIHARVREEADGVRPRAHLGKPPGELQLPRNWIRIHVPRNYLKQQTDPRAPHQTDT